MQKRADWRQGRDECWQLMVGGVLRTPGMLLSDYCFRASALSHPHHLFTFCPPRQPFKPAYHWYRVTCLTSGSFRIINHPDHSFWKALPKSPIHKDQWLASHTHSCSMLSIFFSVITTITSPLWLFFLYLLDYDFLEKKKFNKCSRTDVFIHKYLFAPAVCWEQQWKG